MRHGSKRSTTFPSTRKIGQHYRHRRHYHCARRGTRYLHAAEPRRRGYGSVKVFVVARVIFERWKPKKECCCAATRTRAQPRTRSKPNTSTHLCRHYSWPAPNCPHPHAPQGFFIDGFFIVARSFSNCPTPTPPKVSSSTVSSSSRALWTFEALVGAAGPVTVAVDT